jgi:hypothetical protein
MDKKKQIYKCIDCNNGKLYYSIKLKSFSCSRCKNNYPIIEGVTLAISDAGDFYNYKRKLDRYIHLNKDDKP